MELSYNILLTFGINGSLRKVETRSPSPSTEHYLFNSAANLKAYSNNLTDFAYYGYNASNTRTYKLSMLNMGQWVNGHPHPIHPQIQQAMFYPNAYLNFNHNGEYTKHYYNGSERIASRLGDNQQTIEAEANDRLLSRIAQTDEIFKAQIGEMAAYEEPAVNVPARGNGEGTRNLLFPTVGYDPIPAFTDLQPTGNATDIFYYHTNHLGSTAFVTDQNQTITQGFLYAPFGEITTEYNATFGNDIIPKYSFNAKELDEETGMYYYEARYYKPPVFTSRDPMFEKYFWMTPYAYCANNPVKYVDPDGCEFGDYFDLDGNYLGWDGEHDGKIYFIEDKASISKIKANNINENGTTDVSDVNVCVSTSKQVVFNTLSVYIMTIDNGDNREFATCMERGTGRLRGLLISHTFRGEKSVDELQYGESPSVSIINYKDMEASIHSHPGKYAKWSALDPSDDDRRIQADLNVITGRIDFADGMHGLGVPIYGAVFYDRNWKKMFSIGIEKLKQVYINTH